MNPRKRRAESGPTQMRMIGAEEPLKEEDIDDVEDERAGDDEDGGRHGEGDVCWVDGEGDAEGGGDGADGGEGDEGADEEEFVVVSNIAPHDLDGGDEAGEEEEHEDGGGSDVLALVCW